MKRLIPLLLIPFSVFAQKATAPGCADLSNYLQHYETLLHSKTMSNCNDLDYKSIVSGLTRVVNPEFLADKKCLDFTGIETRLQNARLQLSVLTGIATIKNDISKAHQDIKDGKSVQVAAKTFTSSLDTAQSLEVLLDSRTADKPFMLALRDAPANPGFTAQMDITRRIQHVCKGLPKEGACDPKLFAPSPDAATEIMALVKREKAPSEKEVQEWKNKLAIKRKKKSEEDEPYTFTMMKAELASAVGKFDSKEVLSKAEINAIAKLDEFEDFQQPSSTDSSIVTDLNILKNSKQARIASDKVHFILGDAKLRQQYEIQSNLSIAWHYVKGKFPGLTAEEIQKCDAGKEIFSDAVACIKILDDKKANVTSSLEQAKLASSLPGLKSAADYAKVLQEKETKCSGEIKQNDLVSLECLEFAGGDTARLQDEIQQLNILKERLLFENQEIVKWRNFALQKFQDVKQGCQLMSSPLDYCTDDSIITKDAALTLSSHMQIAVMLNLNPEEKTKAEEEAKSLCEDEEKIEKNPMHQKLCAFFDDPVSDKIETKNVDTTTPPTTPDDDFDRDGIKRRDVILGGLGNLLGTVVNGLYPPQQNTGPLMNPYPYNITPYAGGRPPLGIADGIMFNARYYGAYGFYAPTPGLTPGTISPMSSMSAYKPVSSMTSKYFSY